MCRFCPSWLTFNCVSVSVFLLYCGFLSATLINEMHGNDKHQPAACWTERGGTAASGRGEPAGVAIAHAEARDAMADTSQGEVSTHEPRAHTHPPARPCAPLARLRIAHLSWRVRVRSAG